MSGLDSILQDLASEQFGPDANLRFQFHDHRVVAWLTRNPGDGGEAVAAIAGGTDRAIACRTLIQMLARQDTTLSTQEVAAVLGVSDTWVKQLVADERLVAVSPAGGGHIAMRFSPADVHRLAQLPRRRGQREALAEQPEAHGVVPMVADVLRVMRDEGVDQDEAVRRLGGTP